jgi:hypothetical protein
LSIDEYNAAMDDVTLSFVCMRRPIKLLKLVREKHTIDNPHAGIYYVNNDYFPIQIIVSRELDKADNLYISSLQKGLDTEGYLRIYRKYPTKLAPEILSAYLDAVSNANQNTVLDVYKMGALAYNQMNPKMRNLLDIQVQDIIDNTPLGKKMRDELDAKDKIIEAERLAK